LIVAGNFANSFKIGMGDYRAQVPRNDLNSAEIDFVKMLSGRHGLRGAFPFAFAQRLAAYGINNLAFCVNKRAVEIDESFRKLSKQASAELKKMPSSANSQSAKVIHKIPGRIMCAPIPS